MAYEADVHGQPAEAVTLVETAAAGIRGRGSPRLLAERFEPDSDPPWLYWVNRAQITVDAGYRLLQLGQPVQATPLPEEGIALLDESFARERQTCVTRLATALAQPGPQRDLEAAADRGLAAVRLAESVTSARGIDYLRDLSARMQPHASVPAVADFLDQAQGILPA